MTGNRNKLSNDYIAIAAEPVEAIPEVPKPKRPRTSYNLFFKHEQEKLQRLILQGKCGMKRSNIANIISESWKKITPSVRLHYDQLAAEDKFRYMNERIEYKSYLEQRKTRERRLKLASTKGVEQQAKQRVPMRTSQRKAGTSSTTSTVTTTTTTMKTTMTSHQNVQHLAIPSLPTSLVPPALDLGEIVAPSSSTSSMDVMEMDMTPLMMGFSQQQVPEQQQQQQQQQQQPQEAEPFSMAEKASIADMANKLSRESIEFLIRALA